MQPKEFIYVVRKDLPNNYLVQGTVKYGGFKGEVVLGPLKLVIQLGCSKLNTNPGFCL